MALSLSAMVMILGMSKEGVEVLCDKVKQEICTRSHYVHLDSEKARTVLCYSEFKLYLEHVTNLRRLVVEYGHYIPAAEPMRMFVPSVS
ncbi:unnamed protein product [Clonostachys chloroleuca]|uniref:Uncharacterized protein n=1 Tax=Clonostachys chloroleuca TaxID=1926264 RepID=A0AA35VNZ2_9HYPO|nr:unnamed protein product [Clonostachys chloroleuca]